MSDDVSAATSPQWWGDQTCPLEQGLRVEVGPLRLWAIRYASEWRFSSVRSSDALATSASRRPFRGNEEMPAAAEVLRFGFEPSPDTLRVLPALADRDVVVKPETPFFILSGETVRLFVSTPLWVQIYFGEARALAHEMAIFRPSDTWFGPNTREGKLCYLSRSLLRLSVDELQIRPHRAVTELVIKNRAADALLIDRLMIPVAHLALFSDERGQLWTEKMSLVREQDGDFAAVRIGEGASAQAGRATRVAAARKSADTNLVVRVFQALFQP